MTLKSDIETSGGIFVTTEKKGYDHYIWHASQKKHGGNREIARLITGGGSKIANDNMKLLSMITGGSIKPKKPCDIRTLIMRGGAKDTHDSDEKKPRKDNYRNYLDTIRGKGNSMADLLMNNAKYEAQVEDL